MANKSTLDTDLIEYAKRLGGKRTQSAVIREALQEYVQRRKQISVIDLFDSIEFAPNYDYQKGRGRR